MNSYKQMTDAQLKRAQEAIKKVQAARKKGAKRELSDNEIRKLLSKHHEKFMGQHVKNGGAVFPDICAAEDDFSSEGGGTNNQLKAYPADFLRFLYDANGYSIPRMIQSNNPYFTYTYDFDSGVTRLTANSVFGEGEGSTYLGDMDGWGEGGSSRKWMVIGMKGVQKLAKQLGYT